MAYPDSNPNIVLNSTSIDQNKDNWDILLSNTKDIIDDLIKAHGDGQDFPGVDHTTNQATNIKDSLDAIRHMVSDINTRISGKTNWYDDVVYNQSGLRIRAKNPSASLITKGSLVYISKISGALNLINDIVEISLAKADASATLATFIVIDADIKALNDPAGNEGYITSYGVLTGQNTGSQNVGNKVYLSSTIAGGFVYVTPPPAPATTQLLGKVIDSSENDGKILFDLIDPNIISSFNSAANSTFNSIIVSPSTDIDAATFNSVAGMTKTLSRWRNSSGISTVSIQNNQRTVASLLKDILDIELRPVLDATDTDRNIPSSHITFIPSTKRPTVAEVKRHVSFHGFTNNTGTTHDFYGIQIIDENLKRRFSFNLSDITSPSVSRNTIGSIVSYKNDSFLRFLLYDDDAQTLLLNSQYFNIGATYTGTDQTFDIKIKDSFGADLLTSLSVNSSGNVTLPLGFTSNKDITVLGPAAGFSVIREALRINPSDIVDPTLSALGVRIVGESFNRFAIQKDGGIWSGPGSVTQDVAFYRTTESSHSQWNFRTKPSGGALTDIARLYGTLTSSILSLRNLSIPVIDLRPSDSLNMGLAIFAITFGSEALSRFDITKSGVIDWTSGTGIDLGTLVHSQFGIYRATESDIIGLGTNQRVLSVFRKSPSDLNASLYDILNIESSISGGAGTSGLGAGLLFSVEDTTNTNTSQPIARIASVASSNIATNLTSNMEFWTRTGTGSLTKNMVLNEVGQLRLPTQGSTGGLLVGLDILAYRSVENSHSQWSFQATPSGGTLTDIARIYGTSNSSVLSLRNLSIPLLDLKPSDSLNMTSSVLSLYFGTEETSRWSLTKDSIIFWTSGTNVLDNKPEDATFGIYRAKDTTDIIGLGMSKRALSIFKKSPHTENNVLQDVLIIESSVAAGVAGSGGADGLGSGLLFGVEDNTGTGTVLPVARVSGVATTNTQLGITSKIDFYTRASGGVFGTPKMTLSSVGQLQLPVQGSTAGLLIGADTLLYRSIESSHSQLSFQATPSGGTLTDIARIYGTSNSSILSLRNFSIPVLDLKPSDSLNMGSAVFAVTFPTEALSRFDIQKSGIIDWTSGTGIDLGTLQHSQFGIYRATESDIIGLGTNQRVLGIFRKSPSDSSALLQDVLMIEASISGGAGTSGLGAGLLFSVEDTTNTNTARPIARIASVASANTATDLTSNLEFWTRSGTGSLTKNMVLNEVGQLQLPIQGSTGGLLIGGDVNIYRGAANNLYLVNSLTVFNSDTPVIQLTPNDNTTSDTTFVHFLRKAGRVNPVWALTKQGKMWFGDISAEAVIDVNLYRSAADRLRTDDNFNASLGLFVNTVLANTMFSSEPSAVSKSAAIFKAIASETADLIKLQNASAIDIIHIPKVDDRQLTGTQSFDLRLFRHSLSTASQQNIRSPYIRLVSSAWDDVALGSTDHEVPLTGFAFRSTIGGISYPFFGVALRSWGAPDGAANIDPIRHAFYTCDSVAHDLISRDDSSTHIRLRLVNSTNVDIAPVYDLTRRPSGSEDHSFKFRILTSGLGIDKEVFEITKVGRFKLIQAGEFQQNAYFDSTEGLKLKAFSTEPAGADGYIALSADTNGTGGKLRLLAVFKRAGQAKVAKVVATEE